MNLLKKIFTGLLLSSITLLSGCVSTGPELPDWVARHPQDSRYYIGIGSSNSAILASAQDEAREEALANLAASISTSIVSEVELETGETKDGEEYKSLKKRIEEKVYQTLEGAEVVDSYQSPSAGYWIYIRFDKANLLRQQKELAKRVEEVTADVFSAEASVSGRSLVQLHKGHKLLTDSPYFASLSGNLGKGDGVLIDMIEKRMQEMLSRIVLQIEPENFIGNAGDKIGVSVTLSGSGVGTGIPVSLGYQSEKFLTGKTDEKNVYRANLELSKLPLGRGEVKVAVDLKDLGITEEDYFLTLITPEKEIACDVKPLPLGFVLDVENDAAVPGVTQMAAALFTGDHMPFSMVGIETNPVYILHLRLIIENFPKFKENSLEISQARLVIQLEKAGEVLYTWESGAMKDGGLTLAQSHERTVKKLFEKLRAERKYMDGLITALPVRSNL